MTISESSEERGTVSDAGSHPARLSGSNSAHIRAFTVDLAESRQHAVADAHDGHWPWHDTDSSGGNDTRIKSICSIRCLGHRDQVGNDASVGQVVLLIATVWLAERSRRAKLAFSVWHLCDFHQEFKGREILA